MIYNKLVRDKIPDIIREQGETPNIRILGEKEEAELILMDLMEQWEAAQ